MITKSWLNQPPCIENHNNPRRVFRANNLLIITLLIWCFVSTIITLGPITCHFLLYSNRNCFGISKPEPRVSTFNFQLVSSMLISLKVFGILFVCTFCPRLYRLKTALTIIIIFQSNIYCMS